MNKNKFISELTAAMPDPRSRMGAMAVLARWAGMTLYLPVASESERRARAAKNMIESGGMSSADISNVLRQRFNISARTALRDVKAARKTP
jgi:hypothetical protein